MVATSTSTATTVESLKTSVATLEDTISTHASSITAHGRLKTDLCSDIVGELLKNDN